MRAQERQERQEAGVTDSGTADTEDAEPAKPGISEKLAKRLSAHRTAALQAEVARHPHVALVAVVHRPAMRLILDSYHGSPLNITANPQDRLTQHAPDFGTFTAQNDSFTGTVRTLALNVQVKIVPSDKGSENAADDRIEGRYGYRRITATLRSSTTNPVNHKCVQWLMQAMGLRTLTRVKKRSRNPTGVIDAQVPNVLDRDFSATAPVRNG